MTEYKRQHLVSKVLQGRFTLDAGPDAKRLYQLRRSDPFSVLLVGPRNNLKEDWFIEKEAGASQFEQVWSNIEGAIGAAFVELDGHTGGGSLTNASAALVKDFMALHLVRAFSMKPMWDRGLGRVVPKRREDMMRNQGLIELARSTDVYPAQWTDEQIVDEITSHFEDPLRKGGEVFGETLVELLDNVKGHFQRFHVEIGEAVDGEFILPDLPCVPYESKTRRVGLLAGFGLINSDAIVMPLGPSHIASLVTKEPPTPWWTMDSAELAPLNEALARAALEAVYFRPGSQPESVVRKAWAEQAASRPGAVP